MQKSRLWRGTAVLAAACGLAGAGAGTAVAATTAAAGTTGAAAVAVTITTKSSLAKVSGHTLVVFRGSPKAATAIVSGTVTGAASGATATLLAKRFGAMTYTKAASPVALHPRHGAAPYSFRVHPAFATSYQVQVSGGAATSAARTVYVTPGASITGKRSCSRPVCHIRLQVRVKVPSTAYATETAKHWFLYSRLHLGSGRAPAAPKILMLSHSATASKPQRLHPNEFVVTLRFAFRIGNHSFRWRINFCTRDSEAQDGLGLPDHHRCGNKWISATRPYLG
jgi:hypothetical protein